jgi:hypothetical protein
MGPRLRPHPCVTGDWDSSGWISFLVASNFSIKSSYLMLFAFRGLDRPYGKEKAAQPCELSR